MYSGVLAVVYCRVVDCTVVYSTVVYCTVVDCTVVDFTVVDCTVVYYTVVDYTVVYCTLYSVQRWTYLSPVAKTPFHSPLCCRLWEPGNRNHKKLKTWFHEPGAQLPGA